ncbi:MAG: ComEC/Rec2 family competence protein [Roseivirga sp.]
MQRPLLIPPWSRFPFVRLTMAWMGGLLMAHCWAAPLWMVGSLLGGLLLIYTWLIVRVRPATFHRWRSWLGGVGLLSVLLSGYLRLSLHEPSRDGHHLMHWASAVEAYEAIALEDLHSKTASSYVTVAVRRARVQGTWRKVRGKVRLSFHKAAARQVRYGDVLLVRGAPQAVPPPQNPYTFDYQRWLRQAQVYHHHFLHQQQVALIASRPPNPLRALSFRLLRYCQSQLSQHLTQGEVRAVVLALVLGQRDTLEETVREAYASVGAMHVLAVSGLHVGMLYWCLSLLFSLLGLTQSAPKGSLALSLAWLWLYALVTGLSPSVLRATLMFTLVALAQSLGRQSNIYNTLASSAFLLLLGAPRLIFDVGFQLSYLAVLGIVYLQPRMYAWLALRNLVLDRLWFLTTVSLAAQVATLPLSLHYFHLFPTYFILANWVVVPAALVILCLGLGVLMTSFWPGLSAVLAWLLEQVVKGVHLIIFGLKQLPGSLFGSIAVSAPMVVLLYGLLLTLLLFLHRRKLSYLVGTSVLALLLAVRSIHQQLCQQAQRQVIFYSVAPHQAMAFVKGRQATVCVDEGLLADPQKYAYHLQPSQMALGIMSTACCTAEALAQQPRFPWQSWQGLFIAVWQGQRVVWVHQKMGHLPHLAQKIPIDFLVVDNNAVTTLRPWLDQFEVGQLVIGAANSRAVAKKLQEEALAYQLRCHSLLHQGALTVAW